MKRPQLNFHCIAAFLFIALTGCSSLTATDRFATGTVGGDVLSSQVDSDIARYFFEDYLSGKRANPQWDHEIDEFLKEAGEHSLTSSELKTVADQTSVDFAAMLFAEVETRRHRAIKETFLEQYQRVKQGRVDLQAQAQRYKIILIPGLFYQSKPETKGDLREVRAMLEEAGFEVVSVPILEAGTVEQNAKIIADFVEGESKNDKELILVSTSKGGPDTSYALGYLLDQETAKKVTVWFSVGGVLRGSVLADQWTSWPRRWLASAVGVFAGFSVEMVRSLSAEESLKRMERTHIPAHVCVVHFVGVPLSGTVIDEVKGSYQALRRYGPNDGITLLPDEILDGSTVITALGLDHWYRDPDLKRKILALVSTVTQDKEIERCQESMAATKPYE